MKPIKLTKKDLTKKGLIKLVKRDIEEINKLSDNDLISIVSFFKFLILDKDEEMVFATSRESIIGKHKQQLKKNHNIDVQFIEELVAS